MPTDRGGRSGDRRGGDVNDEERGGEARRERNRRRRSRRYGGSTAHKTRVCPDCRSQIPYVEGVTSPPASCPECGRRFECPACGTDLVEEATADDPSVCPVCSEPLDDATPETEESFTWDG